MRYNARIFIAFVALCATLTSCLKEDNSDCEGRLALRFVFTHHEEGDDDLFSELVDDVEVYIFDAADHYVNHISAPRTSLANGNTLTLQLDEGEYKIIAWGNLRQRGYDVKSPEATRNGYTVSVIESHPEVSDLFYGAVSVTVKNTETTEVISLTRNTSIVRVHILGLPIQTRNIPDTEYSVRIEGKNAVYDFDNNPAQGSAATYLPIYSTLSYNETEPVVRAEFKTQRLLVDGDVMVRIYKDTDLNTEVNLSQKIIETYEDINTVEDLDRRYEYDLWFTMTSSGAFVFIGNNILDWEGGIEIPGEI